MVEARPAESEEPESEKENSPTSEAPSVEDENEHDYESEHEHDGHGSVMMVFASIGMEVDEPPQRQDLQHLALRLRSLRARIHGAASAGGINYSGSQTDGMALHGRTCQRPREVEPMGDLDILQEVRFTPELCDQEQRSRSNPIHWAGTGDRADSPTGASAALPSSSDAGADLLGKDSGSEGQASRGIIRKGEHSSGCQGEPTPRTGSSGDRIDYGNDHDDTRSDRTWDNPGDGNNEGTYNPVKNLKERLSNLRSRIANSGNGIGSTHPSSIGTTSDYDSGKWSSGSEQRWGAGGDRMSHLWGALRSLRERMGSLSPEDQWKPQQSISETNMVGNSCDGQHDSVMDHQSPETFTQTTTCNHQKHVSTTTTTECTTVPDILSVKNCVTKEILPPLARRIAKAAALTAVVLNPVKEIFAAVDKQMDLVEIACSPTSTLTATFEEAGMKCMRVNYKTGLTDKAQQCLELSWRKTLHALLGWVCHVRDCPRFRTSRNVTRKPGQDFSRDEDKTFDVQMKLQQHWNQWCKKEISLGSGLLEPQLVGSPERSTVWKDWLRSMTELCIAPSLMDVNMDWSSKVYTWEKGGKCLLRQDNFGWAFARGVTGAMNMLNVVGKLRWHRLTTRSLFVKLFWEPSSTSGLCKTRMTSTWPRSIFCRWSQRSWWIWRRTSQPRRWWLCQGRDWIWRRHLLENVSRPSSRWWWEFTVLVDTVVSQTYRSYWKHVEHQSGRLSWQGHWNVLSAKRQPNQP